MIEEIRGLIDRYMAWLRDKTALRQIGDWVEITTPYLDRHNDLLQIYAKRENGGYLLTDDGYVMEDLQQSGCALDTAKRKSLLHMTLSGFGVELNEDRIEVKASSETFALRKHNLVQAMLAVNDLFCLAEPTILSIFLEDVAAWLDKNDIRHTPQVKFTGKSGYDHLFDFVIPKSRHRPERILRAINRPNRNMAEALVFSWIDTREVRAPDSRAFAFLNDTELSVPIPTGVVEALRSYEINPILWSAREDVKEELAA